MVKQRYSHRTALLHHQTKKPCVSEVFTQKGSFALAGKEFFLHRKVQIEVLLDKRYAVCT